MRSRLLLLFLAGPTTTACVPRALPPGDFSGGVLTVDCCGHSDEVVELTYLGSGGVVIRKGEAAVMTAPLFSNPGLLRTGLAQIRSDPSRIERHLPDVSDVTAILVGHGHYDHLMDVPYVMRERARRAIVYGSRTMAYQLAPFQLGEDRVRVVSEMAGTAERVGNWIDVGPQVRIMPLVSDHAPHFASLILYGGVRTRPMREEPRSAEQWLAGRPLAFLIDLLNRDGSVGLRIYYQDAVAAAPYGFAPPLSDGVGIDLALIVPATYAEVVWHPEALLGNLDPRHVILIHWENFFIAPSQPAEAVPFTLLPDFVQRLERALPEGTGWELPLPGTQFRFR